MKNKKALSLVGGLLTLVLTIGLATRLQTSVALQTRPYADQSVVLPAGYRDWKLVSVAHEAGNLNDLRAIVANEKGIGAYRSARIPFADGTTIVRIAWTYIPSVEDNQAFGREQSFVPGTATNVQVMTKDSGRFSATGGWGFGQFSPGQAVNQAVPQECFACHQKALSRDRVFTRYTP